MGDRIGVTISADSPSDETIYFFLLNLQLKCCGFSGDVNSESSWAIYKLESEWFKVQPSNGYAGLGRLGAVILSLSPSISLPLFLSLSLFLSLRMFIGYL